MVVSHVTRTGREDVLADWGMIVMFERNASRLIESIGSPSYRTFPSVKMHRSKASVKEL